MIPVVHHHADHDVICHRLTDDDRHAAAEMIAARLLPRVVEGWRHATDVELVYEVRRLHGQEPSEVTTLLLNAVTDEQARRHLASREVTPC